MAVVRKFFHVVLILLFLITVIYGKNYKGAELRTKAAYTYGRFEVNYKASKGSGQTSTFFTYHELGSAGVADWNELDIEILGRYTDDIQFNAITPGQSNHEHHQWLRFDPTAGFHTYAIEWTPGYVAWFVDGEEVYRQTGEHVATLDKDQKIMMNTWPPAYASWVGTLDDCMLPFFAYYDWVSYASHSPGAGNSGTDNDFTFQWHDDFDEWDTNRWAKASHTWNGNNSDFVPDNCVFRDGKMILCLTDVDNIGYVDHNTPFMHWARYDSDTVKVMFSEEITLESAEKVSNYRITGVTIDQAVLQPDHRSVKLAVTGIDLENTYSVVVLGIKDISLTSNTLMGQSLNIQMPPKWNYPLKINISGDAYNEWLGDQNWSDDMDYGQIGGADGHFPGQSISGTTDDVIFQSEQRGLVKYQVRLPEGNYDVRLMLAENYFNESGKRIFDINVEGVYIARNLDLYVEVGAHAAYTIAVNDIVVQDGVLDIHFGNIIDYSLLNGLIIEEVSSAVDDGSSTISDEFYLGQNFPNPFNQSTTFRFRVPRDSKASISIFDMRGSKVESLLNENFAAGSYVKTWNAPVPSGIYFYKLDVSSQGRVFSDIKKMVLLK
ncbi:MAG: family 16 glycosylhydrolase [Candidatus Marinimicrobia bacterium]|nr:family 16 glycosylhydrolase [Candidatus Neomarinimicrobiota bacterium]